MGKSGQWTDIESDAGVFTELVEKFGINGLQFEELWASDPDSLRSLGELFGVVFLFKYIKEARRPTLSAEEAEARGIFFSNQVIQNACATQAIIHILLNNQSIDPGPSLTEFRDFVSAFPPDIRGEALADSQVIRDVHNSFALPDAGLWRDRDKEEKGGEAFHFVSYVPHDGALLELDGLQPGPIVLGEFAVGTDGWVDLLSQAIQERIARYEGAEIRFNLMAVVKDRRQTLGQQLKEAESKRDAALSRGDPTEAPLLQSLQAEVEMLEMQLSAEEEKRAAWRDENIRRRHNYVELILQLLNSAAEKGKLLPLYEKAASAKAAASKGPNTA